MKNMMEEATSAGEILKQLGSLTNLSGHTSIRFFSHKSLPGKSLRLTIEAVNVDF